MREKSDEGREGARHELSHEKAIARGRDRGDDDDSADFRLHTLALMGRRNDQRGRLTLLYSG
jgi:hypothetical protein